MRVPYGFALIPNGTLEVNPNQATIVHMIFNYYMVAASLGKVVDMFCSKQITSPTVKAKWTRATVDHILSNGKYTAILDFYFLWKYSLKKPLAVMLIMTEWKLTVNLSAMLQI